MGKMRKKVVGIIGCGNMGQAILAQARKLKSLSFIIFDNDKKKVSALRRKYAVSFAGDIHELLSRSGAVIIAVKPQDIDNVLSEIKSSRDHLVISVAAGVTTRYIEKKIGYSPRVIRVMPNMPAKIGKGITAMTKGKFARDNDCCLAKAIFSSVGETVYIRNERLIDAVTALSGSGPAYLFFILAAMKSAAERLGVSSVDADKLIYHTVSGSIDLLNRHNFDFQTLISQVKSKGGTTEAALDIFIRRGLHDIIHEGISAAHKRSRELSRV